MTFQNSPKLILKVDLVGDKELKIVLILLDKYVTKFEGKNFFFSKDGFMINRGNLFTIFKVRSMCLPKNFLIGNTNNTIKLTFSSDKERYDFLKSLKNALIEWSKSEFWRGFNSPDKVKINFSTKVWLLF